jgi:hypothetical protein
MDLARSDAVLRVARCAADVPRGLVARVRFSFRVVSDFLPTILNRTILNPNAAMDAFLRHSLRGFRSDDVVFLRLPMDALVVARAAPRVDYRDDVTVLVDRFAFFRPFGQVRASIRRDDLAQSARGSVLLPNAGYFQLVFAKFHHDRLREQSALCAQIQVLYPS